MSAPHTATSYRAGCRCDSCKARHARYANRHYYKVQAELADLRAFKAGVLQLLSASAPSGSPR